MGSDAQKAAELKYRLSKKGKIADCRGSIRYAKSEKGKVVQVHYAQSDKGKIAKARVEAKRKRELGYNLLNNWFPGSNGHHINKENVLFIPEELHQSIAHRLNNLESMKMINDAAFKWFYAQEEARQ